VIALDMLPSDNSLYLINADPMHKVAVDNWYNQIPKMAKQNKSIFVQIPE